MCVAVPRDGAVSASSGRVGWPWGSLHGAGVLGWTPGGVGIGVQHWSAAWDRGAVCPVAAGNHSFVSLLLPVGCPPCHSVYIPASFHCLPPAHSQLGIWHGKQWLGEGQAISTPALVLVVVAVLLQIGQVWAQCWCVDGVGPRRAWASECWNDELVGGPGRLCQGTACACLQKHGFFFPGSLSWAAVRECKYEAKPAGVALATG